VDRRQFPFVLHISFLLVVVHDFNLVRVPVTPGKADPPAVVDPNAVLPGAVALQSFEPVAANGPQVRETGGRMQPSQTPAACSSMLRNFRLLNSS